QLTSQMLGVYQRDKLITIAESLHQLGRKRAIVINGADEMDEGSLAGENHLVLLDEGDIITFTLHPHEVGLPVSDQNRIEGRNPKQNETRNPKENADILLSVLNNEPSPYLDTVLFNAALGLYANHKVPTIQAGVDVARETIASGKALDKLNKLIEFSNPQSEE